MNEQTYPNDEYISGGELYKFLHISKRKMKYLLEHGYIKHIDTGKKTHRFMVKLSDAEEFKVRLETDAELNAGIQGKFCSRKHGKGPKVPLEPNRENGAKFRDYLRTEWSDEPDALPAKRVAELTGFPSQSIYRLFEQKKIFSAKVSDMIFCGKESVISYFGSVERIARPFATDGYTRLIKDFVKKEAKRK